MINACVDRISSGVMCLNNVWYELSNVLYSPQTHCRVMQLHALSISCHSTHVQAAFQLHSYDYHLCILLVDLYDPTGYYQY